MLKNKFFSQLIYYLLIDTKYTNTPQILLSHRIPLKYYLRIAAYQQTQQQVRRPSLIQLSIFSPPKKQYNNV